MAEDSDTPANSGPSPAPFAAPRRGKSILLRILKVVLGSAAVFFIARALATSWPSVVSSIGVIGWAPLLGGFALLLISTLLQLVAWIMTLRSYGAPRIPIKHAAATYTVSQIAKYVPGSIWPAVIQSQFGKRYDVKPSTMYASFTIQLASSVAVAALLSPAVWFGSSSNWIRTVSVLTFLGGALLLVVVFRQDVAHVLASRFTVFRRLQVPNVVDDGALLRATVAILLSWLAAGTQVAVVSIPMGASVRDFPFIVGSNALSWVVGLMIVFLPAGAGAREGVIVLTLGALVGNTEALTIAVLSRFVQVVVDIFLSMLLGWPLLRSVDRA